MITFEQVNCFRAVYEQGSYSAGSRLIGKDRTTVREHVLALEDILGEALFTIQGKKAHPTPLANHLYPRARHLAKQAMDFESVAFSSQQLALTQLTLCYDIQVPSQLLADIDRRVSVVFPHLSLKWLQRDRDQASTLLEKGLAHFAMLPTMRNLIPPEQMGLVRMGSCVYGVYVHPDSPLAKREHVSIQDLTEYPQLVSSNVFVTGEKTMQISSECHEVNSVDLMVRLLANRGWAVINSLDARIYEQQGGIQRVDITDLVHDYRTSLALFYSFAFDSNPTIKKCIQLIRESCRELLI
ncbi:LysR family transcriptional regulator [Vibrio astriarenae]|uniref:LysR family transcriptional regulator n=1 Tax=Vibrio astriarenae TaxID=1481923 RepID=A0A7Z2YFV4_9VIBR|nr:LysR family transcriptional regulator [Vibrio astriarenae]QIA65584.1 LysR family transcriptional regulator [Vibrio astriarenae]